MYRKIIVRHFNDISYFGIIADIDFVVHHASDTLATLMYLVIYHDRDSEHIDQDHIADYLVHEVIVPDKIRKRLDTLVAASCDKH
jgi:hypothetical protein